MSGTTDGTIQVTNAAAGGLLYVNAAAPQLLLTDPFQQIAITDPDSTALESAVVTATDQDVNLFVQPLQNLSAAALAEALDQTYFTFYPGIPPQFTVTATITDTSGNTGSVSTSYTTDAYEPDGGTNPPTQYVVFENDPEVSSSPTRAVDGYVQLYSDGNVGDSSGGVVTILDNGTALATATEDSFGDFATTVTLPFPGTNTLTATASGYPSSSVTVADTLLAPTSVGSGVDTLALFLSQRAEPAGAQFTVSVDGAQIGGVQTITADPLAGQTQELDVKGDFPSGPNTVTISYLNASNSLLLLDGATINGTAVPGGATVLSNVGTASVSFTGPANPDATVIGSGADALALFLSERGQPAGAQFTISVDGTQIGGVQTTSADVLAGQAQQFDVMGDFPVAADTVTISYLNASNSLLFVDSASANTMAVPAGNLVLSNVGSASFSFDNLASTAPAPTSTVGSGPDTLALDLSQRAEPAGAEFTISVDGADIGGVQTVTADTLVNQVQELDVQGDFAPDTSHVVSVDYLNANNSLLRVDSATINGATVAGGSAVLSNNGSLGFSFALPPVPAPVTIGTGPDTLALSVAQDYFQGSAQLVLSVDGAQVGGAQTVTASQGNGQSQVLNVLGDFSGSHTVSVDFLNPASQGGTARALYVDGATLDGSAVAQSTLSFTSGGSQSFVVTH